MTDSLSTLVAEHRGQVLMIGLNRPDVANAINETMLIELDRVLDNAAADSEVRVVILRGMGSGFSSGHDRREPVQGIDSDSSLPFTRDKMLWLLRKIMRVWDFPKPTIAAVHGYCIGAGAQLATCCDLTVVAKDAQIGIVSLPTGAGYLAPAWAASVGPKRAKQLAFDYGSRIDGATSVAWGWANEAVPAEEVEGRALALAKNIARAPSPLLMANKLAINRVAELQGFVTAMSAGIELDLMMRYLPEVIDMRARLKADGLRAAMAAFEAQREEGI